jgi:hypothetical protein
MCLPGRRERGAYLGVIGVLTASLVLVMAAYRSQGVAHSYLGRNLAATDRMLEDVTRFAWEQRERAEAAERDAARAAERAAEAERRAAVARQGMRFMEQSLERVAQGEYRRAEQPRRQRR